jgi:aspartate carbamoyltransferase regulatory subunit
MIGPRTSVELEVYLKEEELFDLCAVCRALVTTKVQPTIGSDTHVAKNVKCSNPECDSRVHDVCYERMVKANSEFRCQECRTGIFN